MGLASRIAADTCRWLQLLARFDAREGFARDGLASTARWLSHSCGISHRTARDHVRVARALVTFPPLAAALGAGRLSYSHARAIARVVRPGDDRTVSDLIELAEAGTVGQLETVARGLHSIDDERPDRVTEYVRHTWSTTGQSRVSARLDAERGALVHRAIEQVARAEEITKADALVRIGEIALTVLADAGRAPRVLRGDERAAVLIHLDLRPGAGEAHIDHGPGLPARVVDRLLCAGRIRTAVHETGGTLRDLGRSHRVVPLRLFRALLLRDGGCAHPGCAARRDVEAHHVQHWIRGGPTDLANLVLLCRRHHHAHHDGAFTIEAAPGQEFVFRSADGRLLPQHVDPSRHAAAAGRPLTEDEQQALVHPHGGSGERLDRDWSISVLAQRRDRARQTGGTDIANTADPAAVADPVETVPAAAAATPISPWDRLPGDEDGWTWAS